MARQANHKYALMAAVPLSAGVLVEGFRLITNNPWDGVATWISHLVSAALALLFATTALALAFRRRSARWASTAFVLGMASPLLMIAHALVTRVLGNPGGLLYLLAAAAAGFFIKRAFSYGELPRLPGAGAPTRAPAAVR
jgi:hypothetical protein